MKTTKLFTSLAALALVLGLGACTETTETETSSEESTPTETETETETETGTTTEGTKEDEESFYVLFVDGNGVSSWETTLYFSANTEIWDGGTTSSATQTNAGDGNFAFYSEEAHAVEGTTLSFEISDGGDTNIQNMNGATTTLPDNSEGTPVFVAYIWLDSWLGSNTNPWHVTVDMHTTDGWSYLSEGQTIAEFAAAYVAGNYW